MAITQIIATLPAVLNDSETFYEDIAIRNNSLVTVSFPSINTWATQANALQAEINTTAAKVAAASINGGYSQNYIDENLINTEYTIALLRAKTTPIDFVRVSGYHTKGDGAFGSNIFEWDATSVEDDNGGTIIKLDSVVTGRYKLRYSGAVNVKWFGAKGDGVTDDTSTVQQAITLYSNIYISNGTYLVNAISIPDNRYIYGDENAIIKSLNSYTYMCFHINSEDKDNFISNISIENITLEGLSTTTGFSEFKHLIRINGGKNITIKNCRFLSFSGDAIYIGSGDIGGQERHNKNITIDNCFFDGVNKENRNGISIVDGSNILINDCFFTRCTKSNMPGAVDIEPDNNSFHIINNIKVANCSFDDVGGTCVLSFYSPPAPTNINTIIFENNNFKNCNTTNIGVTYLNTPARSSSPHNIIIKNNNADNGSVPFSINGVKGVIIEGNTFRNFTKGANIGLFTISTFTNNLVFDCMIKDNTFYRCGSTEPGGLQIFKTEDIKIYSNIFTLNGNSTGGQVFFGDGSSAYVDIQNNILDSDPSVSTKGVWYYNHTFITDNSNVFRDNVIKNYLENSFRAFKTDTFFSLNTFTPLLPPLGFNEGRSITIVSGTSIGLPTGYTSGLLTVELCLGGDAGSIMTFVSANGAMAETFYKLSTSPTTWSSWSKITTTVVS